MNNVDMHLHTIYSDGADDPVTVVKRAKMLGYTTIAIADHDGVGGVEAAVKAGLKNDVHVIPGIELSGEFDTVLSGMDSERCYMHILGYGIDINYKPLAERLDYLMQCRIARNEEIRNCFSRIGIEMSNEEIYADSPNAFIGKISFAKVLVARGYVSSVSDAFASGEFLGRPEIKAIHKDKISAQECISLIRGAGGKAFFAHPFQLSYKGKHDDSETVFRSKLELVVSQLKDLGLEGIECGYPTHTKEQMEYLLSLSDRLGLLCSRGSDDHGAGIRGEKEMGKMQAELPEFRLDYIRKIW